MQAHLSFPDETPVACKLPELQGFQKSTYFPKILYRKGGDLGSKSLPAVGRKSVYSANKDRIGRDFVKLGSHRGRTCDKFATPLNLVLTPIWPADHLF